MKKCPTCNSPVSTTDNKWRPFCSERCLLIDLGEWMDEGHCIADAENFIQTYENDELAIKH